VVKRLILIVLGVFLCCQATKKEKAAGRLFDFVVDKTTETFVIDSSIASKVFKKDETIRDMRVRIF
jgi:hypothetical protein